ncbi:MAG: type II secretion system major pseudopilin GspG [Nitrospinae bacterium]|nr:type II secretion system major pseudopilin GspG [Nitrospinota bacterium]
MRQFNRIGRRGFTLIEILVVVVILGILATVIVPRIMGRPEEARMAKAKVDIKSIETALHMYKIDNGAYPTTEMGLLALVQKPVSGQIPNAWREGGYLPKVPKDPWGSEYVYLSPGSHGEYEIVSFGSDGEQGGEGKNADINSWEIE